MILTLTDLPLYHLFPRPSRVTQRHIYLFALSQPQPQKLRENHRRSRGANHALAFSSSMAAIEAIIQGLASGSHIVYMASLYGGTHRYLKQVAPSFNCTVTSSTTSKLNWRIPLIIAKKLSRWCGSRRQVTRLYGWRISKLLPISRIKVARCLWWIIRSCLRIFRIR